MKRREWLVNEGVYTLLGFWDLEFGICGAAVGGYMQSVLLKGGGGYRGSLIFDHHK